MIHSKRTKDTLRLSHMIKSSAAVAAIVAASSFGASAASVTQDMTFAPTTATGWTQVTVGSLNFANGTKSVSAMTATMSVEDQDWGGHDYWSNQLRVGLFEDGGELWSTRIAGAGRDGVSPIEQTYDILQDQTALDGLNAALVSLDWMPTSDVELRAYTNGLGWPGWSITVNSGNLSVTSSDVAVAPLPAGVFLMMSGLGLAGVAARRKRMA